MPDQEYPLAVVVLGDGEPPLGVRATSTHGVPTGTLADRLVGFPLIAAAQHAGDLGDDDEVAAWRKQPAQAPAVTDPPSAATW